MMRRLSTLMVFISFVATISLSQDKTKELEAALQQNPNDIGTLTALGKIYHDEGVAGDEGAVDKGFECFDKILQADPSNAVAWAYRGSLWTLRARDAWWPFTKMKDVDKGVDQLDKAVDLAPNDVNVRIVRGINSVNLPSMFHRLPIALKDFDYLMNDPRFAHLGPNLQATIYYWAGVAYKNDSQTSKAKELLQKAISADPNSDTARKAESELKQLS
ncbi:MAG TPA: tetratricopeptide repeat protein [Bacteroidota bacterium]|nr:tetratricopeptide repeat protein [Bacteroidota bacterium]